jgi:hypothetical protein
VTHAEAVAFIACMEGVPQEVVDALEDDLATARLERDAAVRDADYLRSSLRYREAELNRALGSLDHYRKRAAAEAAANPLTF